MTGHPPRAQAACVTVALTNTDMPPAEAAVQRLVQRLERLEQEPSQRASDAPPVLSRSLAPWRDHVQGPAWAAVSVVVYGAYGAPESRRLGKALTELRAAHLVSVRLAWRQLPLAQTRSSGLALAAEAAGFEGRFWALHSRLLELHHSDPVDVHAAARHAGVDRDRLLALMTLDAAADRVVFDVEGALAGGFRTTPTVFVNGEWFTGSLEGEAIWAAGAALVSP